MANPTTADAKAVVTSAFSTAVEKQYPAAAANVARLRRVHPGKTPSELIAHLGKYYLGAVATTGAGADVDAIVPNGWVQIPVAAAELVARKILGPAPEEWPDGVDASIGSVSEELVVRGSDSTSNDTPRVREK